MSTVVTFNIEGFYMNRHTGKREWQVWQRDLPDRETADRYLESAKKLACSRMDGGFSKARMTQSSTILVTP